MRVSRVLVLWMPAFVIWSWILACQMERNPVVPGKPRKAKLVLTPRDFGGVPDDSASDRAAMQAALDALCLTPDGGDLYIPPGTWDTERPPSGVYNRFATLSTHCKNIRIYGDGPVSILRLKGDLGGTSLMLLAIDPSATNISVQDFAIDGNDAYNTDEQTHAIALTGVCSAALGTCKPIDGVRVERMTFRWRKVGLERKGDCIRLLGDTLNTLAKNIVIDSNDFADCARSAIEFQRGISNIVVSNNIVTQRTTDQGFDGEASGNAPGLEVQNVEFFGNKLTCGQLVQGDYDLSMTSGINIHVHHNQFCRGLAFVRSKGVHVHDEKIALVAKSNQGVIEVSNACDGLNVHNNVLARTGFPGPIVRLVPHGTTTCDNITITDNAMLQGTAGYGVYGESTKNLKIRGNSMAFTVPALGWTATYVRGTITPVTGFEARDNMVISNSLTGFAALLSSPYAVPDPILTGNTARGPTNGVMCFGTGGFGGGVQVAGNDVPTGPPAPGSVLCPSVPVAMWQAEKP